MDEKYLENLVLKANKERKLSQERMKRRIEMGYIKGKIYYNGNVQCYQTRPKGIQNWYDTRTLVSLVNERFDLNEKNGGKRVCHINGKWQLQIRGKHLRRLLKAMPHVKQVGRYLVDFKK